MSAEYSAAAAKLRAMHSKFLDAEDYNSLSEKKTVREIYEYLKDLPGYDEMLAAVNQSEIHRGELELILNGGVLDDYVRMFKFTDISQRDILRYWFMYHEVDFLIRELQYIYTHDERNKEELNDERFERFFKTHTKINRELMDNATCLADCVEACKNTPYHEPLKRAQELDVEFFSLSMILEKFYYSSLWRDINTKVPKDQRELFRLLVGSKIDALNLMWIYRGKKFFDFTPELVFTYLIPVRYRLSEEEIKSLVTSESPEIFVQRARETKYAGIFEGLENGVYPEENYRKMLKSNAKHVFANNTESLAAVFAFLYLKEFELADLKTVIEGVRYGVDAQDIRRRLGMH